jgi:hypothetical protein
VENPEKIVSGKDKQKIDHVVFEDSACYNNKKIAE